MEELLYFPFQQFSPRFGDKFFSFDFVDSHVVHESCAFDHAVYVIEIYRGRSRWRIERRFREFAKLNLTLREKFAVERKDFPSLPPKTCFRTVSTTFLNARKEKLKTFLDSLLSAITQHGLMLDNKSSDLLEFLKLDDPHEEEPLGI